MDDTADLRRYRTTEAAELLHKFGAPRSRFTMRKDHSRRSGDTGPRFLRDAKGTCWYQHRDLVQWAAEQRAQLSADRPPPPPPVMRPAAAPDITELPHHAAPEARQVPP